MAEKSKAKAPFVPLGAIAECQYGLSEKADPKGNRLYIGMGQLQDGRVTADKCNKLTVSKDVADKYGLRVGDVLFNRTNSYELVGKTAIVADPALEGAVFASYLVRLKVRSATYDPQFLNIWMNSGNSVERLRRLATPGVSQFNIRPSLLAERFLVPDFERRQQRKVVEIDDSLNRVIEDIDALVVAKREYKHGLAQQLLAGKKRFPEFKHKPWHTSSLADHVKVVARKNAGGSTLVLTASGEHGLVDQRRYFNRNVSGADLSKYHLIRKGEFAYNRSAMSGYPYGATKRLDEHEEGVLSTLYLCFAVSDPKLDSDYLAHVFESGVLNRQLRPIVRIGARAHGLLNVADDDFLSISIPLPKFEEQRKIAKLLSDLDREIDMLERRRELIRQYKRGLLNRLLSGELQATT